MTVTLLFATLLCDLFATYIINMPKRARHEFDVLARHTEFFEARFPFPHHAPDAILFGQRGRYRL